ncbi:MmcQ/YjbR family DNA-binding protein [Streptomyces sp. NPDC058874]|uniref:MmcQ/YjbR family DNA-binding protein n=1 Tax=unclassified Streptomyces TaxID=2593676 RepID=UPI00367F684E
MTPKERAAVTVDDVRRLALALPRTQEHLVRDRVKFRIGRIVYLALSRDESELGFAFPKEERAALVAAEPAKFFLPRESDLRFHWAQAHLAALDREELTELVTEAWRMVVPARVAREHLDRPPAGTAAGDPAGPAPVPSPPTLARLHAAAEVFNGFAGVDRSWLALREETGALDLSAAAHRTALHRWLNSWGCRIRYPREGEPDAFGAGLAAWWERHRGMPDAPLAALGPREISRLAKAYAELAAVPVGRRSLGPTAASKALYALRPASVMPWDAAIAERLHGARDGDAFARHLRTGGAWARAVLAEAGGLPEASVCADLGRPHVSLAKILDEYLYVTITHGARTPPPAGAAG